MVAINPVSSHLIRRREMQCGKFGRQSRQGNETRPRHPAPARRVPASVLMNIRIVPISLEEANSFVERHHRHHDPVTGHKFSIAVADETGAVHGVAIVGRPVSRMLDNGWTLEVNRCCTDGVKNGCSMLYRAAWRAVSAMGYERLITYTLPEEGGASLKGAGLRFLGNTGGGKWTRTSRPRIDTHPEQLKWIWEIYKPTR